MHSDEGLVERLRELLDGRGSVEIRMFGGICCMLNANLCVGVGMRRSSRGSALRHRERCETRPASDQWPSRDDR